MKLRANYAQKCAITLYKSNSLENLEFIECIQLIQKKLSLENTKSKFQNTKYKSKYVVLGFKYKLMHQSSKKYSVTIVQGVADPRDGHCLL